MRKYKATITGVSISAAGDLIAITCPATMTLCITRAWVTQGAGVTSEQNLAALARVSTNNATGATAVTPRPMEVGDPVSSVTCRSLPTSLNTLSNAADYQENEGFNWVSGFLWVPAPEERLWVPPSGIVVLRLVNAPLASKTVDAGINFIEIG